MNSFLGCGNLQDMSAPRAATPVLLETFDKSQFLLLQDSSLLEGLGNMLDDSTSEEHLGFPIRLQNTMDMSQGSLVFFDIKILSKILAGDAFCSECAMLKLVSIPTAGSISVFFFFGWGEVQAFPPWPLGLPAGYHRREDNLSSP